MKNISTVIVIAFLTVLTVNAQEKKIKFNKGTLKICSSKNFKIEGYDGNEVIIKSENNNKRFGYVSNKVKIKGSAYSVSTVLNKYGLDKLKGKDSMIVKNMLVAGRLNKVFFSSIDRKRRKGLKKLGKNQKNKDLGIFFTIEQKNGELIFKDNDAQFIMMSNESYTIKIPNSIKLNWSTSSCNKKQSRSIFYNSKASSLSNFNGEVEITTSLNNLKLKDVTGPVSINSIGGNITIEFDKKKPKRLYSVYSNNGFVDVTLPHNSDVDINAIGTSVFSDINFKIIEDKEENGLQKMKLKLNKGKVKMKLDAGLGNIYLRKKKN